MNDLYYGLPTELWDQLCFDAEEILGDEHLGNHIVGIYPAGERVFGIESAPPGILCLYVNSVEALLNPFHYNESKTFHVGNSFSPIYMVELHQWIKDILISYHGPFTNLLPCFSKDLIHQDDSLIDIIEAAKKYLIASGFGATKLSGFHTQIQTLLLRTKLILMQTQKFVPCINSNWDKIIQLSELFPEDAEIFQEDKDFISFICAQKTIPQQQNFLSLEHSIYKKINTFTSSLADTQTCNILKEELAQKVIEFYRFML